MMMGGCWEVLLWEPVPCGRAVEGQVVAAALLSLDGFEPLSAQVLPLLLELVVLLRLVLLLVAPTPAPSPPPRTLSTPAQASHHQNLNKNKNRGWGTGTGRRARLRLLLSTTAGATALGPFSLVLLLVAAGSVGLVLLLQLLEARVAPSSGLHPVAFASGSAGGRLLRSFNHFVVSPLHAGGCRSCCLLALLHLLLWRKFSKGISFFLLSFFGGNNRLAANAFHLRCLIDHHCLYRTAACWLVLQRFTVPPLCLSLVLVFTLLGGGE